MIQAYGGVGINTDSPSAALHVAGTMRVEGDVVGDSGDDVTLHIRHNNGNRAALGNEPEAIYGQHAATGNWGQIATKAQGVYGKSGSSGNYGYIGSGSYGVRGVAVASGGRGVGGSGPAGGFDFCAEGPGENYGSVSSIRWKRDIREIDGPLEKVAQMRGVYYNWDAEHGGQHDVGMIAEEVGEILPEIVVYEENGTDAYGMDYSKLTPLLVEAVKELRNEKDAQISELEKENTALKELLAETKERLVNVEKNHSDIENRLRAMEAVVGRLAASMKGGLQ